MSKKITLTEEQLNQIVRTAWNIGHCDGVSQSEPNDRSFRFNKDRLFNNHREWMQERVNDTLDLNKPVEIEEYKP